MNPRHALLLAALALLLTVVSFAGGYRLGSAEATVAAQKEQIAALGIAALGVREAIPSIARAPAAPPAAAPSAAAPPAPGAPIAVDIGSSPTIGPASAPVTIFAFSDFQCPYCARVTPTLTKLHEEYGDRVQIVFKHFPLPIHPDAETAHRAAEAAGAQGGFWEMHDRIFAAPKQLDRATLVGHAEVIGLDVAAFEEAFDAPETLERVRADVAAASAVGIRATPSFVINGTLFTGAQPYEAFKGQVDRALDAVGPKVAVAELP